VPGQNLPSVPSAGYVAGAHLHLFSRRAELCQNWLEPGPRAGTVDGMIEAFNLTPYQQLC